MLQRDATDAYCILFTQETIIEKRGQKKDTGGGDVELAACGEYPGKVQKRQDPKRDYQKGAGTRDYTDRQNQKKKADANELSLLTAKRNRHITVHSFGHFYSAPSSPLLLRGAPDYITDTVSEFHAEAHRQL